MKTSINYLILFSCICIMLSSCEVFDGKKDYKLYTIEGGKQSSGSNPSLCKGKELRFLAKFDYTAIYETKDPLNQEDINKLYGFSDCGDQHHQNSARFGWRWFNDQIEIFAYCYVNSQRIAQYITSVQPEEEHEYKMQISGDKYIFSIKGLTVAMDRGCSKGGTKYYLYPFFGGDETAPHAINIRIKEL